ncbi:MAG: glycosyltransferase [Candidatus Omnitrophica bacterium]|nr:glycosyltransferase [Candidatus Omnitrophota bacterium]
MSPKVYILLPVHNRIEKTKAFIESLLNQSFLNYHLILIDDGSTDGTADYVKDKVKNLSVITGKGNWWWGGGLHQGYLWLKRSKASHDDVVLIMNNDTEFAPDFFKNGLKILDRNPQSLLLAYAYSKHTGKLMDAGVFVDWRRLIFERALEPEKINCLSTRGLFLRVCDFFEIGGFHPVLLPHYASDYEFTIRAYHKGLRLMTDPALRLEMDESATGYRDIGNSKGVAEFLKKYFSKRFADNPIYGISFVALACPWPWKAINVLRVFYRGVKTILLKLFLSRTRG